MVPAGGGLRAVKHIEATEKVLYNVSCVGKNGLRVLFGANQGRYMHETREGAETFLAAMMTNTGEDRLVDIMGEQARGTFRVDAFSCYASGDARGIYVDDEEAGKSAP